MTNLVQEITDAVVIDFESDEIKDRPTYPPVPCGVAIKYGAEPARYWAWGHHGHANPDSFADGFNALRVAWDCGRPILMHNAKFDLSVAGEKLGLPMLPWHRVHDSLPMLFLLDPRATTYSLKPASERLLQWPPEERDVMIDWLLREQPRKSEFTMSPAAKSPHYAGAYVAWAPPAIAGLYACGDVDRTHALALWAAERIVGHGMVDSYDRERRLLPAIMEMEAAGMRVDVARLERDLTAADDTFMQLDSWISWRIGAAAGINLDSADELVTALLTCGAATRAGLGITKTGKTSTAKDSLLRGVADKQLLAALRYRAMLKTMTTTFMRPWLETARRADGRIFSTWHSTRTDHHAEDVGARTGRFSSTPNFQNCCSADTEILTRAGWVKFDALADGAAVAQYDLHDRSISFVRAGKVVRRPCRPGEMLHLWTREQIDIMVTRDHELLVGNRGGRWSKVAAADVPADRSVAHAGTYSGGRRAVPSAWITLICAAQADGHWNGSGWAFGFHKRRKATRLVRALRAHGAEFSRHERAGGSFNYYVMGSVARDLHEQLGDDKLFGPWLLEWNRAALDAFMNEIMLWDGLSTRKTLYASNSKHNVDWVQIVSVLSGRRAHIIPYRAASGRINWQASIPFRWHSWTTNMRRAEVPRYHGDVYCVRVPTGCIVVRRRDRAVVIGNCPRNPGNIFNPEDQNYVGPAPPIQGLPALPNVRGYIVPYDEGHVLIDRDYSQQELRILGHFEDGALAAAYAKDPWLDVHAHAQALINGILHTNFPRKIIKNTGFGLLYGQGIGRLAEKSHVSTDLARQAKEAYLRMFPGIRSIYQDMRERAQRGLPLRTWGGRLYWCEPSRVVEGHLREFDYRMPNLLIQGSAADCTKEAVIRHYEAKARGHRVLLLAHDEILMSAPWAELRGAMELLRQAMESVEFDVPMLSEGAWSPTNWAELADYDKKGTPLVLDDVMPPKPAGQVPVVPYVSPADEDNNDPQDRVMRDD